MNLPPETLQRLIDFAHAAMEKRSGIEDDATVSQSRRPDGYVTILAKDLRAIQQLGRPSWEPTDYTHEFHEQGNGFPSVGDDVIVHHDECGNYGLAKVESVSSIHTQQWQANWIYLTLCDSDTDWDSLDDVEQDRLYDSLHHVNAMASKGEPN